MEANVLSKQSFCKLENIQSGWISGLEAVDEITLGFYELATKQYHWENFKGDLEVASMTGNVTLLDNKPFLHIHTIISNGNLQSFGGHLKSGKVGVTLEVLIDPSGEELKREFSGKVGLNLISGK